MLIIALFYWIHNDRASDFSTCFAKILFLYRNEIIDLKSKICFNKNKLIINGGRQYGAYQNIRDEKPL